MQIVDYSHLSNVVFPQCNYVRGRQKGQPRAGRIRVCCLGYKAQREGGRARRGAASHLVAKGRNKENIPCFFIGSVYCTTKLHYGTVSTDSARCAAWLDSLPSYRVIDIDTMRHFQVLAKLAIIPHQHIQCILRIYYMVIAAML